MRIGGKIGTGVVVVGMVLSTAQTANAAPPRERTTPTSTTITLITGDRVTLREDDGISVRPGDGREKMTFTRLDVGDHVHVIPADAARLVASGRLDQRLFDLTSLVEYGYDDARRGSTPLIVTHPDGQRAPRAGQVARELPSINGVAMAAEKNTAAWEALTDGGATRTMAAGVTTVWLDGQRRSTLDHSAPQIGAPTAWAAGFTGTGVTVAVLDTGVDQTHPDLADREVAEQNFSNAPDNADNFGHGTHVASIVAGTGARSDGRYRGIAHGASILDGKVLNDTGGGLESWIIAGMEWAAQQGAEVANLSLGGTDTTAVDPLEQAVESLTAQYGTLFVIAAGNAGPGARSVGSPGSAPSALTVGAVDRDDALAPFSSRGPTEQEGVIKPDITAPGVEIVAALHSAGTIAPPVEPGYTALSGTSMATPHVAGAAAILAQQHPDWTGQQLKAVLSASAVPTPDVGVFAQGAGRVDVAHAIDQTVLTEPASVHVGTVAWPHDDDVPVTSTVTYRNLGDADVTLDLAVTATGPDGSAADVFSLSADEVTVPAGGTAAVEVTGDTDRGTVDGDYSGTITATSGDAVTRTPVVVTREVESYDLTLNYVDETGAPTSEYAAFLVGLDNDRFVLPYDEDGSVTVRLPEGRYLADHEVYTGEAHTNAILQPGVVLDRDVTLDVDPRTTRPIDITPPVAATPEILDVGFAVAVEGQVIGAGAHLTADPAALSTARLGEPAPGTSVPAWVSSHWSGSDGAFYSLAWALEEFPTGFTKAVGRRDLATVRATFGAGAPGDTGLRTKTALPGTSPVPAVESGYETTLPGSRTEYVTTEGVTWRNTLWERDANEQVVLLLDSPWLTYRAGRRYDAPINHAVFGPGLPATTGPWAYRFADVIVVGVPLFTDAGGNASVISAVTSGSTRLYLGDQLVGESADPQFGVFEGLPAHAGEYRLVTEATRGHFDVTTRVSAEWTFTSAQVDGAEEPLDLNVVRFAPRLDADHTAPAGRPFAVPLQVQDESGASVLPSQLSVEASYDEGGTWRRVPVTRGLVAQLVHPAGATSVSLRASATDRDGNTVQQTVIRAYELR